MVTKQRRETCEYLARQDEDTERKRLENALEIGLIETFPASDAIAAVQPGSRRETMQACGVPVDDATSSEGPAVPPTPQT